jgi:hypothetical protein
VRFGSAAGKHAFATVAAVAALLATPGAQAACDCANPPCSGTSITVTSPNREDDLFPMSTASCAGCDDAGVSTWTLQFTCNGGECACGRYVNGDYWIQDPDCSSTASGVTFVSESPASRTCGTSACNGLVKNPMSAINGFDERATRPYVPGLDIAVPGYVANAGPGPASFVKAISWNPSGGCDTPLCTGVNCVHSYFVTTLVCSPPPADAFRPPFADAMKPQAHVTWRESRVDYSSIPTFALVDAVGDDDLPKAYERMRMPQVDLWRTPDGNYQQLVGLVNSAGFGPCYTYGSAIARSRSGALMMLLGDSPFASGSPSRLDLARAWIQAGIDYYGLIHSVGIESNPDLDASVRWAPSGGHGGGRKAPLALAALLLNDTVMRQRVREIVARTYPSAGNDDKWFNEDALAYWSPTAIGGPRALFGDNTAWATVASPADLSAACYRWWFSATPQTAKDPYGFVDGGARSSPLPASYTYSLTSSNGAALALSLWPQLREIWAHDPFWQLMDRLEGHELVPGDVDSYPGGLWALDACTDSPPPTFDTRCLSLTCTSGAGRLCCTTPPDPNDPSALCPTGPYACASRQGVGGRGYDWGYTSPFVESAYASYRGCADEPAGPGCAGYRGLFCGDRVSGTPFCVGPECPVGCAAPGDFDSDGIADGVDACPTIADYGQDTDADGVDDACDTCTWEPNPRRPSPPPPNRSYVSGQPDDDTDGRGNRCDFNYDNLGPVILASDFVQVKASVGKLVTGNDCGAPPTNGQPCGEFDHDGSGPVITAGDFNLAKGMVGKAEKSAFGKCDACDPGLGWSGVVGVPGERIGRPVCESAVPGRCLYAP